MESQEVSTAWINVSDMRNGCFVGDDTIAFNLTSHILFTSLYTNNKEISGEAEQSSFYRADSSENGDGVACIAGHKAYPIFAFAENCRNARIFILSYPDFTKIAILDSKEDQVVYLSLVFSENEHLIALTGMLNYNKLQIWYWRTREMLKCQKTELLSDQQELSCSSSLPLSIAQFAYNEGKLNVWEVYGTQKFCKLIRRSIQLNLDKFDGPFSNAYSIEGNILISNRHGDIYNVIPSTGSVSLISTWTTQQESNKSCFAYLKNGFLISGPDGTLKFFKRQKYIWNEIFQQKLDDTFVSLKSYHNNENIIATTNNGCLYKIYLTDNETLKMSKIKQFSVNYNYFAIIYPEGKYFITIDEESSIYVLEVKTGIKIAKIDIKNTTVIQTNPSYPYLAVGNSTGDITCISLFNPKLPTILTEFMLSRRSIVNLRFTDYGNFLIVKDSESNFFIIKSTPGSKMSILRHFKQEVEFKEYFSIESFDKIYLYFLINNEKESKLLKCLINLFDIDSLVVSEYAMKGSFTKIFAIKNVTDTFFAIQKNSKMINVLEINGNELKVKSRIKTQHKMKHFEALNDGNFLVTWGVDGIVCIYDVNRQNHPIILFFVAGNRFNFGIKYANCCARGDFMLTLDQSGNLICTKIYHLKIESHKEDRITDEIDQKIAKTKEIFSKTTSGGFPELNSEYFGKKFTDLKSEETYQMEALESEETRKLLFTKLDILRKKVSQLLDQNEKLSNEEKLPIENFNLDIKFKMIKEQGSQVDRDQQEKKMSDFIQSQTKINNWIIEKCWSSMDTKGAKLRGMFIKMFVEKYPLMKNKCNHKELKRIKLMRAIENSVAAHDEFLPWRPIPTIELEKIFIKEPGIYEIQEVMNNYSKIQTSLMGTNTHKFIVTSPIHYQQLDAISYNQMKIEKFLMDEELMTLKQQFNTKFDQMHAKKLFQINSIRFKNDRLRHILSEMRILDELKGMRFDSIQQILDPDFRSDEQPESVTQVIESEVCVAPYVSQSCMELIEKQEAAREQRRQELEADDFRDRALDFMMDGVLEHKWEDEIKKNPKKPICLIKNKPKEDWSEIETKEVENYNSQLDQVSGEREKYRRMLFEEQKLLQEMLDEEIQIFNYSLAELMMEKLSIDMIIGEEEMKLLNLTQYNFKRVFHHKKEIKIRLRMENMKIVIEKISQLQIELQEIIRDLKISYENLQVKDKTLEKQFKANFNETCPGAPVDQAFKYFKRRPKLQMRLQITSPILMEVAKRVASKKLSQTHFQLLPTECIEYLHGIDVLDQVASSTTGIDVTSWSILCKMRRVKIESEFRIKSLGIQLADAESTLMAFTKEANNKRNQLQSLERSLSDLKETRENDSINRVVQIVMKRGLIEVKLTGCFHDFSDSILVHRSDVDDINRVIVKAGMKKLRALENSAIFSRKMTVMEWEHKVLKLKVYDLNEFVKTIEKVKITKEVQTWLKKKEKGWYEDLSEDNLKRQIEISINSQEKILSDILEIINELENQIEKKRKDLRNLDKQIQNLNIDVSEQNYMRDVEFEREEIRTAKERMANIIERSKFVRLIQFQHSQLLQLTTLLELQRLKTYPTLTQVHSGRYHRQY